MGTRQSRQPLDNPYSGMEMVVFSMSENCEEIKSDDLGPEEQEIFRRFAGKVVRDDQPPEKVHKMLQREIEQINSEEVWMGQAYVRIGIVGTGAGKSTFINSFRGLRAREPWAAPIGPCGTTGETAEYRHPEHDHVILVDFPGALFETKGKHRRPAAVSFNVKEYTKKFGDKMKECNVFLVFTRDRVHDNAVCIAAKAKEMNKKVLFVRSKFDFDVANMKQDDPDYFAGGEKEGEERLLQKHRKDCVTKLETLGYGRVDNADVFVISGRLEHIETGRWDTPALKEAILKQLDIKQKMLLMTTIADYSPTMVRVKADICRSRAWRVALAASALGAIPFTGTFLSIGTMVATTELFKRVIGLNQTSVGKLAILRGKDEGELQRFVDGRLSIVSKVQRFLKGEIDQKTLRQALVSASARLNILITAHVVDNAVDLGVPFVGGVVTAPFSFTLAWHSLCLDIDEYEQCALALHELAFG